MIRRPVLDQRCRFTASTTWVVDGSVLRSCPAADQARARRWWCSGARGPFLLGELVYFRRAADAGVTAGCSLLRPARPSRCRGATAGAAATMCPLSGAGVSPLTRGCRASASTPLSTWWLTPAPRYNRTPRFPPHCRWPSCWPVPVPADPVRTACRRRHSRRAGERAPTAPTTPGTTAVASGAAGVASTTTASPTMAAGASPPKPLKPPTPRCQPPAARFISAWPGVLIASAGLLEQYCDGPALPASVRATLGRTTVHRVSDS